MFDFSGQNVIVSGATRGIGRAIALAFLQNNGRVIGTYGGNDKAAEELLIEAEGADNNLTLIKCDVSNEAQVEELYARVEKDFDTLDILVNNAGIRRDNIVALMGMDDWQRVIDVNLTGTFLMSKQAVMLMMKKKFGRIINITSPMAHLGFAGQANYSASKAGQVAMMKSLAKETAKKKITVNCVSPGFIDTGFLSDLPADQLSAYKKMVPMKRFGKVDEVADAVMFLSSARASYITGSVLEINGGL